MILAILICSQIIRKRDDGHCLRLSKTSGLTVIDNANLFHSDEKYYSKPFLNQASSIADNFNADISKLNPYKSISPKRTFLQSGHNFLPSVSSCKSYFSYTMKPSSNTTGEVTYIFSVITA